MSSDDLLPIVHFSGRHIQNVEDGNLTHSIHTVVFGVSYSHWLSQRSPLMSLKVIEAFCLKKLVEDKCDTLVGLLSSKVVRGSQTATTVDLFGHE